MTTAAINVGHITRTSNNRAFIQAIALGVVLTGVSYALGLAFGWITEINYLEAFAVFTSFGSTYLCVVQRRLNYLFGIVSTIAYCVLFIQSGLAASAILNAYLAPSLLYGFIRWRADDNARPVRHVEPKWVPVYLLATAAAYGGAVLVAGAFGGAFAPVDAAILVGTILAQFLLDNKKIETWIVWAVVNVAAIYVYFNAGLALAGIQYVFFLGNTVYAWIEWRKTMKKVN